MVATPIGFGHVARLRSLLALAVGELADATAAFLDNVERQVGPVDGLPLGTHRRLDANLAEAAIRRGLAPMPASVVESGRRLTGELFEPATFASD